MGAEKEEDIPVNLGDKRKVFQLTYSGFYDYLAFVKTLRSWLQSRGYYFAEKEHSEAPKPGGKEIKVEFTALRDVTRYVQFKITFLLEILRQLDVVVKDGEQKTKTQKGDLEFYVDAHLMKNYKKTFTSTFFRQAYEKYLVKSTLQGYEDLLREEVYELMDHLKGLLNNFKRKEERVIMVK